MKFKNTKISKRTTALLAAAILLLSAGGYSGTKANLTVFSTDYDATIELNEIAVDLLENGTAVGAKDEPGVLLGALDGTVEPTYTYTEKISVKNTGTAPEFVRTFGGSTNPVTARP